MASEHAKDAASPEPSRSGGVREGAGRPVGKLGPTRSGSISLPVALWEKADRLVEERGLRNRSALFVQLLRRVR